MKRLLLLRHAKSAGKEDPRLTDHQRPLAPRGERACAAMAQHLAGTAVDLVLCSTARRAADTWEGVKGGVQAGEVRFEDRLYTFDEDDLHGRLAELDDEADSVMLVGHNPALEMLIFDLTGEDVGKFPTAALAEIAVHDEQLVSLVRPRELSVPNT
jgi:phosphohistidine phosphatase